MSLNEDEIDFLRRIRDGRRLRPADREEDRARQRCRKLGLAEVRMMPRRWCITDAGIRSLQQLKP